MGLTPRSPSYKSTRMKNHQIMRLGCAAIALALGSTPAFAQSNDPGILVLRRTMPVEPEREQAEPTDPGTPSAQYQWSYTQWSDWSSMCSASSTRTREASCVEIRLTGNVPADSTRCDINERDPLTETRAIYSACTPTWKYGEWGWNGVDGAKSSTCSDAPQQTRTATCTLLTATGEEPRPDEQCGAKSTSRTLQADTSSCTYKWAPGEWSDWSDSCSENATRTRTTSCIREQDGKSSIASLCDPNHPDAKTSETGSNMTACSGVITNGGFESGFTGWNTSYDYQTIVADAHTGSSAAFLNNGSVRLNQTATVNVPSGAKVTFKVACKLVNSSHSYRAQINGPGFSGAPYMNCGAGSYTLNTYEYTATQAGTSIYVRFYGQASGTTNQVLIDSVSLTVE